MIGRLAVAMIACWLGAAEIALADDMGDDAAGLDLVDKGLEAYRRLDFAAALAAWMTAAGRGDPRAQTWIGIMYADGRGVKRDHAAAIEWFGRAASNGYPEAEYRLGVVYAFGHGVPVDKPRARIWYELAADHGHVEAQMRLSEFFEFGFATGSDFVRAHMWADIAARVAEDHAQRVRAAGQRDTLAEMMTPRQRAEARRRADSWIERRRRRE